MKPKKKSKLEKRNRFQTRNPKKAWALSLRKFNVWNFESISCFDIRIWFSPGFSPVEHSARTSCLEPDSPPFRLWHFFLIFRIVG